MSSLFLSHTLTSCVVFLFRIKQRISHGKLSVKERHTPVIPSSSMKKTQNMTRDRFLMILENRFVNREDHQTAVYSVNRDSDSRISLRIWWLVFSVHFSDCLLFFFEMVFEMMKSFVCFSPIRFQDLDDVLFLLFHQFFYLTVSLIIIPSLTIIIQFCTQEKTVINKKTRDIIRYSWLKR